MIGKIKLFTILLVLNFPSSKPQLIEQKVVQVDPNTYEVHQDTAGTPIEEVNPLNTIQVIDVIDDDHQIISNIQNIPLAPEISNDTILHKVPLIQGDSHPIIFVANGTANAPTLLDSQQNITLLKAANVSVSNQNASHPQSTIQPNVTTTNRGLVTINTAQNNSSSVPPNNGLNPFISRRVGENSGVINVTFTNNNASITNNNLNVSNHNVTTNASDFSSNPGNASISYRMNVPIKKTKNNSTTLVHNPIVNETIASGLLDNPIDHDALLNDSPQDSDLVHENNTSNGTTEDSDISFRSDYPRKKHYSVRLVVNDQNQAKRDDTKDVNSKESPQTSDSNKNLENVFVIMNTGNISGFQANSPEKDSNNNLNSNDKTDNPNSKLLSSLINKSMNNLAANILDQNLNEIISKNVLLILNSGTISNFQYNAKNSDDQNDKGTFSIDKNSKVIDTKFRRTGNVDADNNDESIEDYDSLEDDRLNTSTVNELKNRNNEAQSQVNSNSKLINNDNSGLGDALFGAQPINEYDLTNLNVFTDDPARYKRSLKKHERNRRYLKNDDEKSNEKNSTIEKTDVIKSQESGLEEKSSDTNRSLAIAKLIEGLKLDKNDCLSKLLQLTIKQIYKILPVAEKMILDLILPYLGFLKDGNEKIVNLVTQKLDNLPYPIRVRLQLLQADPIGVVKAILEDISLMLCPS